MSQPDLLLPQKPMNKASQVLSPIANLRKKPQTHPLLPPLIDRLQETQVLYGDCVHILEIKEDWARVLLPQQMIWKKEWKGYEGWIELQHLTNSPHFPSTSAILCSPWAWTHSRPTIESSCVIPLSLGTRLSICQTTSDWIQIHHTSPAWIHQSHITLNPLTKKQALDRLFSLLGTPYFWGGMSGTTVSQKAPYSPAGVDCSGLVALFFRLLGQEIPRNAKDQFKFCNFRSPYSESVDLDLGDLLFFSPQKDPESIDHVAIFTGSDLLEATEESQSVRRISLKDKLRSSLQKNKTLFWGSSSH